MGTEAIVIPQSCCTDSEQCWVQQDSYLQALVRAVQHTDVSLQQPAVQILACLIAQDPSTHYVCAEVGINTTPAP